MNIAQWWPKLDDGTREWLVEHNGEELDPAVLDDVMAAAGGTTDPSWWSGSSDDGVSELSDKAIDWIEAKANGEDPDFPG